MACALLAHAPPDTPSFSFPLLTQFYLTVSLLEGKRFQQAVEVVKEKFVPTMMANYLVGGEEQEGGVRGDLSVTC